jgi:hypothetical protein
VNSDLFDIQATIHMVDDNSLWSKIDGE